MPEAAAATEGFFATARSTASLNVTRATGAGVCAAAIAGLITVAKAMVVHRSFRRRRKHRATHITAIARPDTPITDAPWRSALALRLASNALDDHIQNRNEREIQKRRRNH